MKNLGYFDKSLVNNSTLACLLLTYFIKEYEKLTLGIDNPDLMKLLLVLPIVWHGESCKLVSSKKRNTGIKKVLTEYPLLTSGLDKRIKDFSPITIQGLNIANAVGLIERKLNEENEILLISKFERWPNNYSVKDAPLEMIHAIDRLVFWFKSYPTPVLYSMLLED
ncbi:hypothetical protein AYK86_04735 [Acinetobacter venetianus]|uniref:three component ABC system middle component n=1 Tax=Acinetobacter venetianus TaxID=52133 RepID=UPI000775F297|nr:three component ABC system middle component [Acinetobacter venetianus]KXO85510.1 hypothetical protein AYK86_04735 [Acinetobacter venetianus]